MASLGKSLFGIAVGIMGAAFIGYCIYFDKKRRNDPDYKKKVYERRRQQKTKSESFAKFGFPNLSDHEAVERYFLQELQLGETLIAQGEFDEGVNHLANSLMVCGQPGRLLQVLQTSLPAQVFAMLIMKMQDPSIRANLEMNTSQKMFTPSHAGTGLPPGGLGQADGAHLIDDLE